MRAPSLIPILTSLLMSLFGGTAFARLPDTTVTYARVDTIDLKLDLYLVGRPTGVGQPALLPAYPSPFKVPPVIRRPLIVWIHGGGWRGGSRADYSPAWTWVDSGYSVASVDYRLSGQKKWPAQLHDVKAAVRWLRANADAFALDTARFVVWGSSAGAHLAAMTGLTTGSDGLEGTVGDTTAPLSAASSAVRGVIDFYGATNFLEPNPKRWAPWSSVGELIGCGVRKCMDHAWWASPVAYVHKGNVPFLIVHGTLDTVVPITQSILLDSLLRTAKVPVEFHKVEDGHGGPTFDSDTVNAWVGGFLRQVLGPALPAPVPVSVSAPDSTISATKAGPPNAPANSP